MNSGETLALAQIVTFVFWRLGSPQCKETAVNIWPLWSQQCWKFYALRYNKLFNQLMHFMQVQLELKMLHQNLGSLLEVLLWKQSWCLYFAALLLQQTVSLQLCNVYLAAYMVNIILVTYYCNADSTSSMGCQTHQADCICGPRQ